MPLVDENIVWSLDVDRSVELSEQQSEPSNLQLAWQLDLGRQCTTEFRIAADHSELMKVPACLLLSVGVHFSHETSSTLL